MCNHILSIFAQKYLRKCEDRYILTKDSFGPKILKNRRQNRSLFFGFQVSCIQIKQLELFFGIWMTKTEILMISIALLNVQII